MATGGATAGRTPIRFGEFELDLSRQTLTKGGIRLKLQNQPCQVLALLIEHAPKVVSREEIQQAVWGENVHIDVERNINFCVRQIRAVLLDNAATPRYIETLPRQGYRFVAPLEGRAVFEEPERAENPGNDKETRVAPIGAAKRPQRLRVLIGLAAMLVVGLWAAWLKTRDTPLRVSDIVSVTNYPGDEREPTLSPGGRQVAFSWDGEDGRHIYVKLLGEQKPLRLTHDAAEDSFPAWSPDGKQIAFMRRRNASEFDIILIPSMGGPERIVHRVQTGAFVSIADRMMAWTPDSKWLCFTSELAPGSRHSLFLLSPQTGGVRPVFERLASEGGDSSPAFSPDGHWLAFGRYSSPSTSKLFIQRLTNAFEADGEPILISHTSSNPTTPVWQSDNRHVLFLDDDGSRILQSSAGGFPELVYSSSAGLSGLTIDASAKRLIVSQSLTDSDIWTVPLRGLTVAGDARRILYSTAYEGQPRFSPDGRLMAFSSTRSGASEIWLADSNGDSPRQLTHIGAYIAGYPKWSPDSKLVVFHARVPGDGQIYTIGVHDGVTRQITHDLPGFADASFSRDGRSVYMIRDIVSAPSLYRVSLSDGVLQYLWTGCCALEAPGRNLLLYAKFEQRGIYARSLSGIDPIQNKEIRLLEDYVPLRHRFAPVNDGIYYVGCTPTGQPRAFRFYSFASGNSVDIAPAPANYSSDLAISPDRKVLAYTTHGRGSEDLMQFELK